MSMSRPFATIILAGGKGTRMGTSARHKVCFEVLGVPVIVRALETYNLCGATFNVVVVGMRAESVMATVGRRFPGTAFAFQDEPLGTGDAARRGAEILERMRFAGDVLVVAGDKVIDPHVVRRLLAAHVRSGADVTLATAKRPADSTAGIVLKSARGNIVGILEEAERQRLAGLATINMAFGRSSTLARRQVERILAGQCGERTAQALAGELWPGSQAECPAGEVQSPDSKVHGLETTVRSLSRVEFQRRFAREERMGRVRIGQDLVAVEEVLERFGQVNLSAYLFRAAVLHDALHRLKSFRRGADLSVRLAAQSHDAPPPPKSSRPSHEEYLTDVFEILTRRKPPARVVGCPIEDPRDLMAFNNPSELLAIEEVYRAKEGRAKMEEAGEPAEVLARAAAWANFLQHPSASARRQFRQWYGEEVPWQHLRGIVADFIRRHGEERKVVIVRSPGRINLMGRHIDHQGGAVNVMAVNREIVVVAAPRADDLVSLSNTKGAKFSEEVFRISDLIANLNWDDWPRVIDGPRLQRLLETARGDWGNYVKAAILRLQEQFRDRRLRGLDMLVSGDIPMGAGLSSSSALVVAAAEAVRALNRLPVSAQRLVSLCGEGEWFVGTRGGAADHAAIKLSRRGCVTRVGFFPFQVEDSAPFFPHHDLVVCNSGIYAGKSNEARDVFNAKVTAYHLGRVWFKLRRPDLASRIEHLRDINREHLGLAHAAFAQALGQLPARLTRREAQAAFGQMADADRDRLERMFQTHEAPAAGYPVRGVVIFGLAEMARARRCLELLQRDDAAGLGRLMALSHDGDRVSPATASGGRRPPADGSAARPADRRFKEWAATPARSADLAELPGQYGCSLLELDRIVDLARRQPGVEGAQLAGAGLGGCIMALVRQAHSADLLKTLGEHGIQAEIFRPIAGAGLLRLCGQ